MKRPAFLPERVLARGGGTCTLIELADPGDFTSYNYTYNNSNGPQDQNWDGFYFYTAGLPDVVLAMFGDVSEPNSYQSPAWIEVYVNGVKYTKGFQADGGGPSNYEVQFYPNSTNPDPDAFSTGDVVRIVFTTPSGCFDYEFTAGAPD